MGTEINIKDKGKIGEINITEKGNIDKSVKKQTPWISGSFYLVVAIVAITGLAVLSNSVHWTLFPIIIIGGILLIGIIGLLQLKNDDKISDKSFTTLLIETYKRLPLLKYKDNKKTTTNKK